MGVVAMKRILTYGSGIGLVSGGGDSLGGSGRGHGDNVGGGGLAIIGTSTSAASASAELLTKSLKLSRLISAASLVAAVAETKEEVLAVLLVAEAVGITSLAVERSDNTGNAGVLKE